MLIPVLFGSVAVAGLAVMVTLGWPTAPSVGAIPADPAQVSLGRSVYAEHCASCHGRRLEGQANWRIRRPDGKLPAPPHDETGHTWHHPDAQLFGTTKHGLKPYAPKGYKSDMPAFASTLTDREIWASLAFIKSTWPPRIRERQERIDEAHRSLGESR